MAAAPAYSGGGEGQGQTAAERFSTLELGDEPAGPGVDVPTPAGPGAVESVNSDEVAKTMSSVSETIREKMTMGLEGEVNISLNHDIYNAMILLITGGVWSEKMNTSQKISMATLTFGTMFIQSAAILTMFWGPTDYPKNWDKTSLETPLAIRCLGISLLIGNVGQMFREGVVFYNICVHFREMENEHMLMFLLLYGYNATLFFYTVSMVQRLIQWQQDPVDALLQVVAVHFINEIDDYMLTSLASPVSLYLNDEVFDESFVVTVKDPSELNVMGHMISNEGYIAINSIIMSCFMFLAFHGLDFEDKTIALPTLRDCIAMNLVGIPIFLALKERRHETHRLMYGFYFMCCFYFGAFIWLLLILTGVNDD